MASTLAIDRTARSARRALGWEGDQLSDGSGGPNDQLLWTAATTAWGLIEGVTRGRGCPVDLLPTTDPPSEAEAVAILRAATPPPDLAAVALTATMRLAPNPAQRRSESTTGDKGGRRVEGAFDGFTLAEMLVLRRYRRRVG